MDTYVGYVKVFEILKDLDMSKKYGGTHFEQDEINSIVAESGRKIHKEKKLYSRTESKSSKYLILD